MPALIAPGSPGQASTTIASPASSGATRAPSAPLSAPHWACESVFPEELAGGSIPAASTRLAALAHGRAFKWRSKQLAGIPSIQFVAQKESLSSWATVSVYTGLAVAAGCRNRRTNASANEAVRPALLILVQHPFGWHARQSTAARHLWTRPSFQRGMGRAIRHWPPPAVLRIPRWSAY